MAALLRLLIVGGVAVAGLAFILFQVLGFKFAVSRLSKKVKRDIGLLEQELAPLQENLVPLDKEELELFSLSTSNVIKKGRFSNIIKGNLISIYEEPLVAFCYKTYDNGDFVLLLSTHDDDFTYSGTIKGTDVYINGIEFGVIDKSGVLRTFDNKLELARLVDQSNRHSDILVGNRKVASLLNPQQKMTDSARAFLMLDDFTVEEEEDAFLSLAMLSIIQRSLD